MKEELSEKVEKKATKLADKIREDGWMADTKDALKEDVEKDEGHFVTIEDYRDVVREFEKGWEETLHFDHYYRKPLFEAIQKEHPDWEIPQIYEVLDRILNEVVWDAYHDENDTFDIAKELWEKKREGKLDEVA